MDQEIIPRQASATSSSHSMGMVHSLMSAAGVALLTVTKLGASFAATIWAVTKVLGLPDFVMYALMVLSLVPVIWASLWVAGRAWHVEQLLESGRDVDRPVFRAFYYWRKR